MRSEPPKVAKEEPLYAVAHAGAGLPALLKNTETLRDKISCGLAVYIDREREWSNPDSWLITLCVNNITNSPVLVPMASLNPEHRIIETEKAPSGKPLQYSGSHMLFKNSSVLDEGFVHIPSKARIFFALRLPNGHPFRYVIDPGQYSFSWQFHPEAKCTILLTPDGQFKTISD